MWYLVALLSACTAWLALREVRLWLQARALRRRESQRFVNRFRGQGR